MVFTTGIMHPNEFSETSGKSQFIREIPAIEQSIRLLCTTEQGELFGDPNFGSHLTSYIYMFSGEALFQMIRDDIAKTITEQESRVIVSQSNIQVFEESTTLKVIVPYQIKYTNYESEVSVLIQKRKEEDY